MQLLFCGSSRLKHFIPLSLVQILHHSVIAAFTPHPSSCFRSPSSNLSIMKANNENNHVRTGGKVVVVGSINQDLTTYAPSLPKPGETLLGTDFVVSAGGKGSNQAVAAASIGIVQGTFGADANRGDGVFMIGRVGDDDMGRGLLKGLSSRKVRIGDGELEESVVRGAHTGVASIVVDTATGQNTIVVSPGANLALKPENVATSLTKILSGENADRTNVVLVQLEINPDSALEALKTAKRLGALSILNPAPAPKGWELSNEWYSSIDILIPNESELALLCGISEEELGFNDEGGITGEGEEAMAKSLLSRGVQHAVIVTLGARGAMIVRRQSSKENAAPRKRSLNDTNESSFHDNAPETIMISEPETLACRSQPVVDTVGAGDSFCGALAAYLSRGVDLEIAASMACGVASMSVRKRGAQESYPKEQELPSCLRLGASDEKLFEKVPEQITTITFVTGNKNKLAEVQRLLLTSSQNEGQGSQTLSQFIIDSAKIDLSELQGSPHDIAIEKCRLAAQELQSPVMIEDTSLCFHDLNGLPGPYIKWFLDGIGLEGLNKMLDGFNNDRRAYAQTIIAFCAGPGNEVQLFKGQTEGKVVRPRGSTNFGWDPIFEPDEGGGKTYAEMDKDEKNAISHRGRAFQKFREYLSNS
ncbi:hypothetical protein HJC23_005067 [Cyclotella cryptica]|uniref:Multifunctional fusion protein n=1 Tax=Cyclotella cryptica TaxID=29204 RepID=A0ABD3QDE5_9STRA|eukprot:CCRYP_006294-RA/>CCRYP_006294-RA protein AED:0.00 eAED:0.00 QI:135/-1/1/1/-1/1/1/1548/646